MRRMFMWDKFRQSMPYLDENYVNDSWEKCAHHMSRETDLNCKREERYTYKINTICF
jgi:hypothetical protein